MSSNTIDFGKATCYADCPTPDNGISEKDWAVASSSLYFADLISSEPSQPAKDENLISAATFGETDRVKSLLENGADPRFGEYSALRISSANGHHDTTKALLEWETSSSSPEFRQALNRSLSAAAKGGYDDVVKLLISKGADVHASDGEAFRLAGKKEIQTPGSFFARRPTPQRGHANSLKLLKEAPVVQL